MRTWHATWHISGKLFIWGESAARFTELKQANNRAIEEMLVHPFALTAEELEHDLAAFDIEPDRRTVTELSLPSADSRPIPSPLLASLHSDLPSSGTLNTWQVPALEFEPYSALALLTSIPADVPPGLTFDDSFLAWVEATKLLLELLSRGRYLPQLVREGDTFAARWHPILSDKDVDQRFKVIVESFPRSAIAAHDPQSIGTIESFTALQSFLYEGTDALVRIFLRRYPLLSEDEIVDCGSRPISSTQWLSRLTAEDPRIQAPTLELLRLESRLQHWAAPVLGKRKRSGLSVAFRLSEPELPASQMPWIVTFYLQHGDLTQSLLPASEIWNGNYGALKHANISLEEVEEALLRELGRALPHFPELASALSGETPTHLELTSAEAYRFLRDYSSALSEAGFQILLPDWWSNQTSQLGLRLKVPATNPSTNIAKAPALGMDTLLDYQWEVAIGNQSLSDSEFVSLVQSQEPLAFVNGQWVELNPARLKKTLEFLEKSRSTTEMSLRDVLRFGLGMQPDNDLLPVVGFHTTGWLEQLLAGDEFGDAEAKEPVNFLGELRKYQRQGLAWLKFLAKLSIGGCLADDMGLGKTVQFLALLAHERESMDFTLPLPTLLVVPMSILGNWHREATRFTPQLKVHIHHGTHRLSGEAFLGVARESDVVLTTYSIVQRDEALLSQIRWARIALDEAQNIKNLNTKQTRAVRRLTFDQMSKGASGVTCERIALTGTPLENHLEELWSIFDFLNPGFLGDLAEFRRRFVLPIERYRDRDASEVLSKLIRPFVLRRLKSDPNVITDLPEKIEIDEYISLSPEQAALYQKTLDNMLPQVDAASGMHRKGLVLATITRLKQVCDHPGLYLKDWTADSTAANRSGKLSRLSELLETILDEGDKVLIFTQFSQMGELLQRYLEERFRQEVLFLHGGLPQKAREKVVLSFQRPEGPRIFVLSLKAGGYGLNLTEANQVIHYDQWWNPAVQDQATDRAYRIGQKRNVQVRRFICKGTLEEKIAELLTRKREMVAQIVGSTRNILTELSTDELRQLLALSAEELDFAYREEDTSATQEI